MTLNRHLDGKGENSSVSVDFPKASDRLNRNILMTKVNNHNIGKTPNDQAHQEHTRKQLSNLVHINDSTSIPIKILQTNDVLQGDPLSPLIFNTAIIEVVSAIHKENSREHIYIYIC
jgi:hypothetical protein